MNCRFCKHTLKYVFIDMLNSPASNSYLSVEQLNEPEMYYPLKVYVCDHCFLVQIDEYKKSTAIFDNNYAYFSSYSSSWLNHCKQYTQSAIARFNINENSRVVELASNDGYLLQYFLEKNIPVLGIEPTQNTAAVAQEKGINTLVDFFSASLATHLSISGIQADLLIGNNVLAHVPNIIDFVHGMKILLKPQGVITMEFPHLIQLVDHTLFDTIYHEHYSYLSLFTVRQIFNKIGLEIFDVQELPTHGGSLRIYAKHMNDESKPVSENVSHLLEQEMSKGVNQLAYYQHFTERVETIKLNLLEFLVRCKKEGKRVAAYGAAAKGNTLLNYCGVKSDLIDFVVDANPAKQSKYMPASHIPIYNEEALKTQKPDYVLILPWNLKDEIVQQLDYIRGWGAQFVIPIPELIVI
jgi:SAM-dependent methyltransferase